MKAKLKTKKAFGAVSFTIESDKNDQINYVEAERLQRGDLQSFVSLTFDLKGKVYCLQYQVQGLASLSELLKTPFPPLLLCRLLQSFLGLMRDCEENDLMRQRVVIDLEKVFFDTAQQALRFAYVPLQSFVTTASGINGALVMLCEKACVPAPESWLRDAALDYVRRTPIITSIEFALFLKSLGVLPIDGVGGNGPDEKTCSERSWCVTDHLGERTDHGLDFVSSQLQKSVDISDDDALRSTADYGVVIRLSTGQRWEISPGKTYIGRALECCINLQDVRGLSRNHAVIEAFNGCSLVYDLGSTNGVFVNERRLGAGEKVQLFPGDKLRLGDEFFLVSKS